MLNIIAMAIVAGMFGVLLGIVIRLKERNLPISMITVVFYHLYCLTIGFRKMAYEGKDELTEAIAASGIEKGTENKREIINERKKQLLEIWDKKYVKRLHKRLLKDVMKEYDYYMDRVFESTSDIYIESTKKRHNMNKKSVSNNQAQEFAYYLKTLFASSHSC
jgi:hypothetical protein